MVGYLIMPLRLRSRNRHRAADTPVHVYLRCVRPGGLSCVKKPQRFLSSPSVRKLLFEPGSSKSPAGFQIKLGLHVARRADTIFDYIDGGRQGIIDPRLTRSRIPLEKRDWVIGLLRSLICHFSLSSLFGPWKSYNDVEVGIAE